MINWKKASKHTPTSEDATPYISCIVWVCNPNVIQGGIMDMVRWDVKNNCWYKPDMLKWFYEPPYEITHFSSERNVPSNENFAHELTKEPQTEALNKHNVGGRSEQSFCKFPSGKDACTYKAKDYFTCKCIRQCKFAE